VLCYYLRRNRNPRDESFSLSNLCETEQGETMAVESVDYTVPRGGLGHKQKTSKGG
jgi:hypothetical protein